ITILPLEPHWIHYTNSLKETAEERLQELSEEGDKIHGVVFPAGGKYVFGPPKATEIQSSAEITKFGIVGIYYVPETDSNKPE
ncbi:hypothetical protein, partial [Escherichia coli]|uniref:hypothetical protein n=1 Tax=Escherichia coli TaxID=562 RepID=UPI001965D583